MSEPKFTKGEWKRDKYGTVIANGETLLVTGVAIPCGYHKGESEANTNLLAAAPDLYKEIEQDILWLESMMPKFVYGSYEFGSICRRIETKRKLLAKARGEK